MKRKEGIVLLIVLIVFMVFSVLSLSLVFMSQNQINKMQKTEINSKSHYLAYSGAQIAINYLESGGTEGIIYGELTSDSQSDSFTTAAIGEDVTNFDQLRSQVEGFSPDIDSNLIIGIQQESANNYRIICLGTIGDISNSIALRYAVQGTPGENPGNDPTGEPEAYENFDDTQPDNATEDDINFTGLFDHAIFGLDSLTFGGGSGQVIGSIGTNSNGAGKITIDNYVLENNSVVHVGPGGDTGVGNQRNANQNPNPNGVVQLKHWVSQSFAVSALDEVRTYQLPAFPDFNYVSQIDFPDYPSFPSGLPYTSSLTGGWWPLPEDVNQSGSYNSINIQNYLNFDTTAGDLHIRTNNLSITGSGQLRVEGNNKLYLYVADDLTITGSSKLLGNDNVYIYCSGEVSMSSNSNGLTANTLYINSSDDQSLTTMTLNNLYVNTTGDVSFPGNSTTNIEDYAFIKCDDFTLQSHLNFVETSAFRFVCSGEFRANSGGTINDIYKGRIVCDELTANGGSSFDVGDSEDARLKIYCQNDLTLNGGFSNGGSYNKTTIYVDGNSSEDVHINGGTSFSGTMYVKDARRLHFNGGSNLNGVLLYGGEDLRLNGGFDADANVVYAPNAELTMQGGAHVKGAVVVKDGNLNGGARITYVSNTSEDVIDGDGGNGTGIDEIMNEIGDEITEENDIIPDGGDEEEGEGEEDIDPTGGASESLFVWSR